MRSKGLPAIKELPPTKRSPRRFQVRWDRGRRSFTDTDRAEVFRFAVDLVTNDYVDPRTTGGVYGKATREASRDRQGADEAEALRESRMFRTIAQQYLTTLEGTPSYLHKYRRTLETHVYPYIGKEDINDVKVYDVERITFRYGPATSSRKNFVSGLLSPIFDYAIDREWRDRANPCRAVSKLLTVKPVIKPMLDLRDAPMFLEHCYTISLLIGDFASLLYGTGRRWQEASALTGGAVDLKRRVLQISQVERAGETGAATIATDRGKSDASFRDVPLPQSDADPLIAILNRRIDGRRNSDWLFTATRGGRIYKKLTGLQLGNAREAALAEDTYRIHITPHAFRRGFAQAALDRGASTDQVKQLLGHTRLSLWGADNQFQLLS